MANPKMVCSYRSSCIDLPVALVDCQMKGCESRLNNVYQGEYMGMHEIDLDGEEWKICSDCIDRICMRGDPEKVKKT